MILCGRPITAADQRKIEIAIDHVREVTILVTELTNEGRLGLWAQLQEGFCTKCGAEKPLGQWTCDCDR